VRRLLAAAALPLATFVGCQRTTGPAISLARAGPPDMIGVVASSTYLGGGATPGGIVTPSYDIWIAVPPSTQANAGVVYAAAAPVYLSLDGRISRDTAADIRSGDTLEVWHSGLWAYGSSQAPPGDTAYQGTLGLIVR